VKKIVLLFSVWFLLESCTWVRVFTFFLPSVEDHHIFPRDTITSEFSPLVFPSRIDQRINDIENWIPETERLGSQNIVEFLNKTQSTAFVVLRKDTILYEYYASYHKPQKQQIIFSVSKSIVNFLAAIAIEEGKMKMEQKVSDFLPEFKSDQRVDIQIKHLMNMVSGLNAEDKSNLFRLSQLYYNTNLSKLVRNYDQMIHDPGSHFAYASHSTQILAFCIEKAMQKNLTELFKEKIFIPLSFECDAYLTLDTKKNKALRAYGGFALCTKDLLKLGQLMLHRGMYKGRQIVPSFLFDELIHRTPKEDQWWGYLYGIWRDGYINESIWEDQDFFAAGFNGQFIYVNPKDSVVIIRQGLKEPIRFPPLMGRLSALISQRENDLTVSSNNYADQFEGVYESNYGEKYEVVQKGINTLNGEPQWIIFKDLNQTLKVKKLFVAQQIDGKSIGVNRFSYFNRAIFKVKEGRVEGMFFDNQRSLELKFFEKKSDLGLNLRKVKLNKIKAETNKKVTFEK